MSIERRELMVGTGEGQSSGAAYNMAMCDPFGEVQIRDSSDNVIS